MPFYRKLPVVNEAIKLENNTESLAEVLRFVGRGDEIPTENLTPEVVKSWGTKWEKVLQSKGLVIKTIEGDHLASWNDYIIKGVAGELYPCKADIFKATYEPVNE